MKSELTQYQHEFDLRTKEEAVYSEMSLGFVEEFARHYIQQINTGKNEEHPLVYNVRLLNRYSPESIPLIQNLNEFAKNKNSRRMSNTLEFEGRMRESVNRPLDYVDDFDIGPYHWRKRTFQENFSLPLYQFRYKFRTKKKMELKAQELASFYLQMVHKLYSATDNFMYMAAADALHRRGEFYALDVMNFAWENHAKDNGYNVKGYHYPNGKFEPTEESEAFKNPIVNAIWWLSLPASGAWKRLEATEDLKRNKRISRIVSKDRETFFEARCKGKNRFTTHDQVRNILLEHNIDIGRVSVL